MLSCSMVWYQRLSATSRFPSTARGLEEKGLAVRRVPIVNIPRTIV